MDKERFNGYIETILLYAMLWTLVSCKIDNEYSGVIVIALMMLVVITYYAVSNTLIIKNDLVVRIFLFGFGSMLQFFLVYAVVNLSAKTFNVSIFLPVNLRFLMIFLTLLYVGFNIITIEITYKYTIKQNKL